MVVNHYYGGVRYLWRTLYINSYGKGFGNEPYLSMVVRFLKWNWKQNFISFGSFNLHTNNDLEFQDDPWWELTPWLHWSTLVIMSIAYYNMVGMDMESNLVLQNGFMQRTMELSKWSKWKMVKYSHEINSLEKWNGQNGQNWIWSTWNFRVQAKA